MKKTTKFNNHSDVIINIFTDYINKYKSLINDFINTENRINENIWVNIYNHVKMISKDINNNIDNDLSYKSNNNWKLIDTVHENDRKRYIKDILNTLDDSDYFKGYLIFTHLSIYLKETSK